MNTMKKLCVVCLMQVVLFLAMACGSSPVIEVIPEQPDVSVDTDDGEDKDNTDENMESNTLKLTIGSRTLTATLVDNSSTRALKEMLSGKTLTIEMSDYGNFEKVGPLGAILPRNDERITTQPGDLILYQGNSFVIYYAPNTWSFTRLGKIDDISQSVLMSILGVGDVTVTLSLQ